jgi:acid phosphatase type 7
LFWRNKIRRDNSIRVVCIAVVFLLVGLSGEDALPAGERGGVMVGAGDIAGCVKTGDEVTADLSDLIPGAILTTSEDTHELGSREEPDSCYGRNRSYSNGEAGDPNAGYYSYDLGAWHVISLDSAACEEARECEEGSPLLEWLEEDLAANEKPCTLAYWRHPLFSSGPGSNHPFMWAVWDALYAARANVVVNGHDHTYERFAPDPGGKRGPGARYPGVRGGNRR